MKVNTAAAVVVLNQSVSARGIQILIEFLNSLEDFS
jgi:hypothetical protein